MNDTATVSEAMQSGPKALNEHASKQLLEAYGVPVIREVVTKDAGEALAAAQAMGFPVVLKGLGSTLLHKTERALVHLNITEEAECERAARAIAREAGDELEGFLVQPYLTGRREFVAGFSRDAIFGPVIMFGIGGIFTEALSDVVLRIAPLTATDAEEMLAEIKAQRLLGDFRGEKAADREALVRTLLGLSRLALEHPEIAEVDINPLLASPQGEVCAVDALVVLSERKPAPSSAKPVTPQDIGSIFYPSSIVFIGASSKMGKWGHMLLTHTIGGGFTGAIHLVNEKGGTIAGRQVYTDIAEVPGAVDLAVVTIPARHIIDLLPKLKDKGIKYVLIITSGFAETGAQGRLFQQELVEKARQEGLLILGPNTMGIANPHINLYCTGSPVRPRAGGTAMIAHSGTMGIQLLGFAEDQGIGIRSFCGSGNEAMITIEDFLECYKVDEPTQVVMVYAEGIRDGKRFFDSARSLARMKPVVLLKGGQSEAGNRAASSHTGALTSNAKVFDAVCKQTGIVKVEKTMELMDLAAAFSSLPLPRGNRVGIMTMGGGWGVITADLCARFGLVVPELSPALIECFDRILPPYWSKANPVDIVGEPDQSLVATIMEELLKWDGCDSVINLGVMGRAIYTARMAEATQRADPAYSQAILDKMLASLTVFEQDYLRLTARLMERYQKPVYGVSILTNAESKTVYTVEGSAYKPVFYQTPERAVKANARMYERYRFLNR